MNVDVEVVVAVIDAGTVVVAAEDFACAFDLNPFPAEFQIH